MDDDKVDNSDGHINKKLKRIGSDIEASSSSSSSWSDLPKDLLTEIISQFYFADRVRFLAVCKNWLAVDPYQNSTSSSLPWVISMQQLMNNTFECQFHEPSSSNMNPYAVDIIEFLQLGTFPYTFTSLDTTCKYGWLFFSIQMQDCSSTNFVLFSLLTKELITLPTLIHSESDCDRVSFPKTFSTIPSSPDCVFLVLEHYREGNITIRTCRRGDKEWSTRKFVTVNGDWLIMLGSTSSDLICIRGILFIVSNDRGVTSYNIVTGEWKVVRNRMYCRSFKLFEFNGDLAVICFLECQDCYGCIHVLDRNNNAWVPLMSLGDQALFISGNIFTVSTIGKKARDNRVFPNKIYWLVESGCFVYSLKNGRLVKCAYCSGITKWDQVNNYLGKSAFWVEPPDYLEKQRQPSNDYKVDEEERIKGENQEKSMDDEAVQNIRRVNVS